MEPLGTLTSERQGNPIEPSVMGKSTSCILNKSVIRFGKDSICSHNHYVVIRKH